MMSFLSSFVSVINSKSYLKTNSWKSGKNIRLFNPHTLTVPVFRKVFLEFPAFSYCLLFPRPRPRVL